MIARKGKDPSQWIKSHERNIYKNWQSQSVLALDLNEDIPNLTNHDISESNMRWGILYQRTVAWHFQKIGLSKELHFLVRALNCFDKIHKEEIFVVCKKIMRKLID